MNTFINRKLETKKIGRLLLCITFLLVSTLTGYSSVNPSLAANYTTRSNGMNWENSAGTCHTTANSTSVVAADSVVYSDGLGKAIQPQTKSPANNQTICDAAPPSLPVTNFYICGASGQVTLTAYSPPVERKARSPEAETPLGINDDLCGEERIENKTT
jgi:hypothetical protein